jgi:phospholipid transport system substrate-binding protein
MTLDNCHDQAIEFKPLRIAPGETQVTARSSVKQPGTGQLVIDWNRRKPTAGWKACNIKIAGVSPMAIRRAGRKKTVSKAPFSFNKEGATFCF